MLRWRLMSAAIILGVLLAFLHVDFHYPIRQVGGAWLIPLALLITGLACSEVLAMLAAKDLRPPRFAAYAGSLLIVAAAAAPLAWPLTGQEYPADCPLGRLGWPLLATAVAILVVATFEVGTYQPAGNRLIRLTCGVFTVCYAGLLMSFVVLLRTFHDHRWGMAALLSLIAVVKMSDVGAYTVGRLIGKHKLAPALSPGKTIEGCCGGIVFATLTSWFVFHVVIPRGLVGEAVDTAWYGWLSFGVAIAITGMLGDLVESLLKRETGCKDSSTWLPGLGGVLDIMDSILVAAPIGYAFYATGIVGP